MFVVVVVVVMVTMVDGVCSGHGGVCGGSDYGDGGG